MKAQYLSLDAVIAAIIFLVLLTSLFTFLRFSLFSNQYYEKDIDFQITYASNLLLSRDSTYSIVDISKEGKMISTDKYYIQNKIADLGNSIPYFLYVVIDSCPSSSLNYPYSLPSNIRLVSSLRRVAVNTNNELCTIDIYLGVYE